MQLDAADFIRRKPQFAAVDERTIQIYLEDAALFVDASWPQKLIKPALAAATCHLMTLAGLGNDALSEAHKTGAAEFSSVSSGGLSLTRAEQPNPQQSSYAAWLSQTPCGRAFLQLLTIAKSGPRIIRASHGGGQ